MSRLSDRLGLAFRWADDRSGGRLQVLRDTVQGFNAARAPEAAAGLAYYALFSLFPLLIALVAAGSFFLEREQVYGQAVSLASEAFPISRQLIERNVQQVLELRGAVGLVGLASLLWSATGFFTILARNVNRAWPHAESRGFFAGRLVALGMVGTLAGFLMLSLLSSAIFNLLPRLDVPLYAEVSFYDTPMWEALSNLVPWLFAFLMFLGLYRWVPNADVCWSGPLLGALVAAFAWEVAAGAFAWFLGSGLIRYELIYGSLGAVIALMLWIYVGSLIALFGAHLSAAVGVRARNRRQERDAAIGEEDV